MAFPGSRTHIAVVGAGAFGGWTALELARRGARVTLLDAWGPGNSRASSGGETRIIRAAYGPERVYTEMSLRSFQLWRENEARWNRRLYRRTGILWMAGEDDQFEKASAQVLREAGVFFEELTPEEASRRYPQMNFERVNWVLYEKEAGYLTARRACEVVLDAFLKDGGEYRQLSARPGAIERSEMRGLPLSDGSEVWADHYVFACGPWLGKLFPDLLDGQLNVTRQEEFFFGTPAGDARYTEDGLPIWLDGEPPKFYGIPGNTWRGFKIGDDARGAAFDPTSEDRQISPARLEAARDYLAFRFARLQGAPLLEARVCQYENTPDHHFILDRHPQAENAWLVGGGSGHGFKHGPAVGERVAGLVLDERPVEACFALSRFSG